MTLGYFLEVSNLIKKAQGCFQTGDEISLRMKQVHDAVYIQLLL